MSQTETVPVEAVEPWAADPPVVDALPPPPEVAAQVVDNPPYVPPMGPADAPPPVPPEPNPDPETQAWLDAHEAPPDPRDPDAPPMDPEDYTDAFVKPPDPRDTGTNDPTDGELIPPAPGPGVDVPTNVDVPHATQTGATLNCTMGNWTGIPDHYTWQWTRDGVDVGAPAETDALTVIDPDDVGHVFACVVTASNAMGTATAPPSNDVTVEAF